MSNQTIKTIKPGTWFYLSIGGKPGSTVYVRGPYDRHSKKYSIYKWHDVNDETFVNGTRGAFPIDF